MKDEEIFEQCAFCKYFCSADGGCDLHNIALKQCNNYEQIDVCDEKTYYIKESMDYGG